MRDLCAAVLLAAGVALGTACARSQSIDVAVYKTPTCGCCAKWVDHLEDHGFSATTQDLPDLTRIKRENGVPRALESCHTAVVDGYVIEGHVPASDIARLLETRPPVAGLAVPGMPVGSPGMEGPNPESYRVVSFDADGRVREFSAHRP